MTSPDQITTHRSPSNSEPNNHTVKFIHAAINAVHAIISTTSAIQSSADPRTELDSHANMVVLGKHSYIFESTGRTSDVKPFTDELGIATDIPIVDGAIAYDCPYTRETYILIVRNALYIKTMDTNLIPSFIMRQGGVIVNDVPKIQCQDPSIDDHCISFSTCDLRIPLQLMGVFSYFHSRKPLPQELFDKDKIFLTPDSNNWNPHCLSFEQNERTMLNYEGELNEPHRRANKPMIDDDYEDIFELSSVTVDDWNKQIDSNISNAYNAEEHQDDDLNELDELFAKTLSIRAEISKVQASLGSTTLCEDPCELFQDSFDNTLGNLKESLTGVISPESINDVVAAINSTVAFKPNPEK